MLIQKGKWAIIARHTVLTRKTCSQHASTTFMHPPHHLHARQASTAFGMSPAAKKQSVRLLVLTNFPLLQRSGVCVHPSLGSFTVSCSVSFVRRFRGTPAHSSKGTSSEAAAAHVKPAPSGQKEKAGAQEKQPVQSTLLLIDPATGSALERQLDALVRARYGAATNVPGSVRILQNLVHYLWPQGEPALRLRVIGSMACLVGAKLLNIQVPFFFKHVVDSLSLASGSPAALATIDGAYTLAHVPLAVICAYGIARIGAAALTEARSAIFASVAQNAIRCISLRVFEHVHQLGTHFTCFTGTKVQILTQLWPQIWASTCLGTLAQCRESWTAGHVASVSR